LYVPQRRAALKILHQILGIWQNPANGKTGIGMTKSFNAHPGGGKRWKAEGQKPLKPDKNQTLLSVFWLISFTYRPEHGQESEEGSLMTRRMFALMLTLILALGALPVVAHADDPIVLKF
jgi:hypothetical protein